jgi:hypothetical protein
MSLYGAMRSGDRRIALLVLALAAVACRKQASTRPLDAASPDAAPLDAVTLDAAAVVVDAAAKPDPVPTRLVASGDTTCAVMSDLTVRCWGGNAHGQLGDGTTADAATPVTPDIRAVKDLQLADGTACALLDDASVACWGRIAWHGHAEDVLRPTGVLGVIGVTKIFVVGGRACARLANESLVCWGNVDARGHFVAETTNRIPTPVVGLDHVAGLHAAGAFSDDGRFWSWGRNGVPRLVDATGVQEIAEREGTVCGRLQNGRVMCAPGDRCGARRSSKPPPPAPAPSPPTPKPSKTATTGKATKSGATKSGATKSGATKTATAKATSSSKAAKTTTAPKPSKPASSAPASSPPTGDATISLGFPAARQLAFDLGFCVVTNAGKLECGDGCKKVDPPKLEHVNAVVGRCALLNSGAVTCFADNKATTVSGLTRVRGLAVGAAHACVLADDKIFCWGNDDHHQLGSFRITS